MSQAINSDFFLQVKNLRRWSNLNKCLSQIVIWSLQGSYLFLLNSSECYAAERSAAWAVKLWNIGFTPFIKIGLLE